MDLIKEYSERNIELVNIFEDEWVDNKEICQSVIKQKLGLNSNKIMARKCQLIEVSNTSLKGFLKENHLQGWVQGTRAFALAYNNEIVSVMTFGRPRFNKTIEWELLRLAIKKDYQISGGIDKLWKFALQELSAQSIVSYCDRRWFTGSVYGRLGFNLTNTGDPTYWYVDKNKRKHRVKYQKHKLIALGYDPNMSEKQITLDVMGIDRIWDAGQDTWIWTKTEQE